MISTRTARCSAARLGERPLLSTITLESAKLRAMAAMCHLARHLAGIHHFHTEVGAGLIGRRNHTFFLKGERFSVDVPGRSSTSCGLDE